MKFHLFCTATLILGLTSACFEKTIEQLPTVSLAECPLEPQTALSSDHVQTVFLERNPTKVSGKINAQKSVGYAFQAKVGQKLNYTTNDDICLWVYTPDNELVTSPDLAKSGQYILQVAVPQGAKTFAIEMSLEEEETEIQTPLAVVPAPSVRNNDFPKNSCGDSKPTDPAVYPIAFYPVNVPYSTDNLAIMKANFCRDAYKKKSKSTGIDMVQVASFLDIETALEFSELIRPYVDETTIGEPSVHYK